MAESRTFERPLPRWRVRFHTILGLCCWLPGPAFLLLGWLDVLPWAERALERVAAHFVVAPGVSAGATIVALFVAPIALQVGLLTRARRTHGRCRLDADAATFAIAPADLDSTYGVVVVPRGEIQGFEARPGAIHVRAAGRASVFEPLVIPVSDEEEERAALAWLEERAHAHGGDSG